MTNNKLYQIEGLLKKIENEDLLEQINKLLNNLSKLSIKEQTMVIEKITNLLKEVNQND